MPKVSERRAPPYVPTPGRALLDVNVLIALLDAGHVHHDQAMRWLAREITQTGWASCPITQIGCIRIMSQPAYPGALNAAEVAARLSDACADAAHAFWPADVPLTGASGPRWDHVLGHRQVTDLYLLALAVRNGGSLVTFDRRISIQAVPGARDSHLRVIADDKTFDG
jgi:uncharacterized protein